MFQLVDKKSATTEKEYFNDMLMWFHPNLNLQLIDRYKVELDEELNPPVNWTDADLFLETSIDFSGLLIKTNKSGQYRLIPSIAFSCTLCYYYFKDK